jgi:hypothetical protein
MSDLRLNPAAIAGGIATAQAVWNSIPTDLKGAGDTYLPLAGSDAYIADAGYAYAILSEAARLDGAKMPFYAGGESQPITGDPAPTMSKSVADALDVVRDYARWAAETKPLLAQKLLEV